MTELLCYTSKMRKLIVLGALLIIALLFAVTLFLPPVRSRLAVAPLLIQSRLNALKPTAVIPTPAERSDVSRDELLGHSPTATPMRIPQPTVRPTVTAIQPATAAPTAILSSPTTSPTETPTATPIPVTPRAPTITLSGFTHDWQTWNNCGPTTISMNLSFYGIEVDQADAAQILKPNSDDKNVDPDELAAYAREQGVEALVRVNGDLLMLQTLLSNGFPIIVETWLGPEDRGGLGHYRLFSGYDQAGDFFIAQDSLRGPDIQVPAAEFDNLWRIFNRKYIVVYPPAKSEQLQAILGPAADDELMLAAALQRAQAEAQMTDDDPYSWFNIGSNYAAMNEMTLAAAAYDEARRIGLPYRMFWYQFEPFAAYLATERYQEVIDLTTATLQATGGLEELYFFRAMAQKALGDLVTAKRDLESALDYNRNFAPARAALELLQLPATQVP